MKQGWMAIRWVHPKYLASCKQGWMAIRWAHPRLLASSALGWTAIRWVRATSLANICLTRGDGHTVGSSQTPCNMKQGWMATRWAHPKYLATCEQGWMAIRWAHPRLLASSALGWTAIRWVRTTSLANICLTRGGWPHGGFIPNTLQYEARMDGHTVGPS
jgi:hypothetical protein